MDEGIIFGLLVTNEAGKPTTVKILTTLSRSDSGRDEVAGFDLLAEPDRVRRTIGCVDQRSGVDGCTTCWNVSNRATWLVGRSVPIPAAPLIIFRQTGGSGLGLEAAGAGPDFHTVRVSSSGRRHHETPGQRTGGLL